VARLDGLAIVRGGRRERPSPCENLRQEAADVRGQVLDDEERRLEIWGQLADQDLEGFDAAGGGPHDDDIVSGGA
jgi:hypothetical protein